MRKFLLVLLAGGVLTACGAPADPADLQQDDLRGVSCSAGAVACCRRKFWTGRSFGVCVAEAARGKGPCAQGRPDGGTGGDAGSRCPSVQSVTASADSTATGAKFRLSAAIADDGTAGTLSYDWHLASGSVGVLVADPATREATLACTAIGPQVVELTVAAGVCSSSGTVTIACTTLCGNGVVDPGEACDPPDGIACDGSCQIPNRCPVVASVVPGKAVLANFGDTVVTATASDPDPGNTLSYTWTATAGTLFGNTNSPSVSYECTSVGEHTVSVSVSDGQCSTSGSAQITCLAVCGNGIVEPGEQCDRPYSGPDGLQCDPSCQLLTCGNGVLDPGEQCDPPQSGVCSMSCRNVFCGNGVVDPGEDCEPPGTHACSLTCKNLPIPTPQCAVPSPNAVWKRNQQLSSSVSNIVALSPSDAWLTTSSYQTVSGVLYPSQLLHWNGASWSAVLTATAPNDFRGLWASGPNDVWMTGDRLRHWDGNSWTDRSPTATASYHVRGSAADDVWVSVANGANHDSLWHWNGAGWEDRTPPDQPEGPVTVGDFWPVSSTDVWVAASFWVSSGGGYTFAGSMFTHWNGSGWSRVSVAGNPTVSSFWGSAANDIWAASGAMFHFDGATWSQVSLPGTGSVFKLWGSCATDVWAIGSRPLHFDGGSWVTEPTMPTNGISAIGGTSANDVWIGHGFPSIFGTGTSGDVTRRLWLPGICGDGVIDPGETCDPPRGPSSNGGRICDATCHMPTCGNGVIDPGETCDPPNFTTCDTTCNEIPIACGNAIQQPGEGCDVPNNTQLCQNCALTNCGACFGAMGGGAGLCTGLDRADTVACNLLVGCAATRMASCAYSGALNCYCSDATCSAGANGQCAREFEALAHSSDPAVVRAQIADPSTPVGKVGVALTTFQLHSPCGVPCIVQQN